MKAIVHIGTHKTGTTAIQTWLKTNQKSLLEQGYFVPNSYNPIKARDNVCHHRWVFGSIYEPVCWENSPYFSFFRNSYLSGAGLTEEKNTLEDQDALWQRFVDQIPHSCDTIILSSEFLSLCALPEIENLKKRLMQCCSEVRIICYLRRQTEFLVSFYSQLCKFINKPFTFDDIINLKSSELFWDYKYLLGCWSQVFKKDNVSAYVYERSQLTNQDIVIDFARNCGIETINLTESITCNESISSEATEFCRLFGAYCPTMKDLWLSNPQKKSFYAILGENFKDKISYLLTRSQAKSILDRYRESNNAVAREYFGRDTLFSDDCSSYPEETAPHDLTVEKAVEIGATLWKELHEQNEHVSKKKDKTIKSQDKTIRDLKKQLEKRTEEKEKLKQKLTDVQTLLNIYDKNLQRLNREKGDFKKERASQSEDRTSPTLPKTNVAPGVVTTDRDDAAA